ncbi:outer membrane beta-barrel protein [Vibrio breoganii]
MKHALLILSLIPLSTPALSAQLDYFMGGGLGGQWANLHTTGTYSNEPSNNSTLNYSNKDTTLAGIGQIRTGAIINSTHRIMITGAWTNELLFQDSTLEDSSGQITKNTTSLKQREVIFSYDYLHPINRHMSIFIGGSAGYINNNLQLAPASQYYNDNQKVKKSDFTYGIQLGAVYKLHDNWSADITYRRMFKSLDQTVESNEADTVNYSLEEYGNITISLDYHF